VALVVVRILVEGQICSKKKTDEQETLFSLLLGIDKSE
jgi:hypothetical protein